MTTHPALAEMGEHVIDRFATTYRSHLGGALRLEHAGTSVRLGGWVHRSRDLGGIIFLDLRDRAGLVQVKFDPAFTPAEVITLAASLGSETVVLIEGDVVERPAEGRNPDMASGDIEVRARTLRIAGPAVTPTIPVARGKAEKLPAEDLRLRHRYLDLRRPELQHNLILRHRLMQATRACLSDRGFLEIETPILTKPTPEGARDYLVPSRVHPGEFYALPQSPQLYKQLLMVSGFDRYFQIARCFRDEDLRADRQPEFTQIDIEASFVDQEDIIALTEGLLGVLFREVGMDIPERFPRLSYREAMERFGIDRPDLRYGLELFDATSVFHGAELGITRTAIAAGGRVRGIVVPGGSALSRKQLDEIDAIAKAAGAGAVIRLKRTDTGLEGSAAKFLGEEAADRLGMRVGDLALLIAGADRVTSVALDRVRQEVARRLSLVSEGAREFVWVLDFPLFDRDPTSGALASVHHPFTAPAQEDIPSLETAPERVRARAYDVVLNGTELGGGSIRIGDPRLQERIFSLLGIDEAAAQTRFGFLLEGLRAGAPPHGGIALGFDRIAMLLAGGGSLRDVIAFPKTTAARALFEGAPSPVAPDDLRELHLRLDGDES
jgi:aspartyl-tRNA synthetase